MAAITLRDGSRTEDARLDRIVQFDERSRNFPIAAAVPSEIKRGRSWSVDEKLDQGREGACVGFGIAHELAAYPAAVNNIDDRFAQRLYRSAQQIDPWPGDNYDGTSVLAGVKTAQSWGYFTEYRWAFSVEDIMRALAYEGPVVVGTDWYEDMYEPRGDGLVRPTGRKVGGHCWLIRGFSLKPNLKGVKEPIFRARNSWGGDWGVKGDFFITLSDYETSLLPGGEAVVFMGRHKAPQTAAPIRAERAPDPELDRWADEGGGLGRNYWSGNRYWG